MSTFYTTFLSKSDFSFVLLLVTFEPLEVKQSYIPLLKALICGINVVGAQGCSCMFTFCLTPLKIALLLHKMANGPYSRGPSLTYDCHFMKQKCYFQRGVAECKHATTPLSSYSINTTHQGFQKRYITLLHVKGLKSYQQKCK